MACRLRCLQQGTLNVGNTQQNRLNLLSLALTEANTGPSFGRAMNGNWATWVEGFGPGVSTNGAATGYTGAGLLVIPALVPGFVKPIAS